MQRHDVAGGRLDGLHDPRGFPINGFEMLHDNPSSRPLI
jgi:hypothetical protein